MNIKKAAIINAIGSYSNVILSIVVNAILSRILSPNDYGVVAVITVFTTFFTTISDTGFASAIIQNKDLDKKDINNIFSFMVYLAIILMLVFCLCTIPISLFYDNKVYIPLGLILSISLFFSCLNIVPNGILKREKKFINIAIRDVFVYFISATVAVILALLGFGYYALAIQSVLSALLAFIYNVNVNKLYFIRKFDKNSIKKILNYSTYQFLFNLVNYFSSNLDNLLTGKFMGETELGYYNKAYSLMLYPVNNLSGVITPVLHPVLADYQDNKKIIYEKYLNIVKLLALMGVFVTAVSNLASYELINILYGPNWNDSVETFKLLTMAIVPQMINSSAGSVFQAIGNTKLLFINGLINTIVTAAAIIIGVFLGGNIESLALCIGFAYIFKFFSAFIMLIKIGFKYSFISFIRELVPETLILIVLFVSVKFYPFSVENIFLSAIAKGLFLLVIYLIMLIITKEYKLYLALIKK